ncbi:MAG TPA: C4-dicarboxylate ABC transporter permease, partial [Elusimicrobia bacterium]|nr:C4-dicarboxylate ABC transporter permease [Elusimicrobiota bacterium]
MAASLLERLKKVEMPHPLVILFGIVLFAAAATYVLPGGEYQRVEKDGRQVAVAGSYQRVPHRPQGLPELALVPFSGMMEAAEILVLLFIIGGAFNIIKDTGALSAGIHKAALSLKGREAFLIPVLMSLFGLAGGIFGMYEEVLPFVGVVVPMAVAIGYDSITGVCIVYLGTVLGFCGAFFNPFTVGIAQGVAGLPLFSGLGYRLIVWTAMVGTGIVYTMLYAARVRKNPASSAVYESDKAIRSGYLAAGEGGGFALDGRRKVILLVLAAGFAALPVGVISWHWGIKELAGLFFALGILSGGLGGKSLNAVVESFVAGARDMMGAALLIGV